MQKTERVFIFVIVLVGFLFLYILSIFVDMDGRGSQYDAPVIQEIEDSDFDLDDEDLDLSADAKRSRLKKLTYAPSSYTSESYIESDIQDVVPRARSSALQTSILDQIKVSEISLSQQEALLSKDLARKGYSNPSFLNMQMAALNKQPYKRHRYKIKQMEIKGQFKRALTLIDSLLKETSEENYLLLGEIYQKAYELALQSGSISLIDKYSKLYLKNTGTTLKIFQDSKFSESHKGRETIYQMTQQLNKAKSGNIATLFAAIGSKEIQSLGLLSSLKASTKLNADNSPFSISNDDISKATEHSRNIFKNIHP
ncbi:hypothetical protein MJH12_04865 [bacterium]|nr:hypothetical protein [bacterium]